MAAAPAALAQGTVAKTDSGARRDPAGVTGISPFWETVKRGDSAYTARDLDGALALYRQALKEDPTNAHGHYRVGQIQILKGDIKEAEAACAAALRSVGADHALKAKLLFVTADLAERRKAHDEALAAWEQYAAFLRDQPKAKGHPDTASDRKTRLTAAKQLATDSAAVKSRIEKRLQDADDRARKNTK